MAHFSREQFFATSCPSLTASRFVLLLWESSSHFSSYFQACGLPVPVLEKRTGIQSLLQLQAFSPNGWMVNIKDVQSTLISSTTLSLPTLASQNRAVHLKLSSEGLECFCVGFLLLLQLLFLPNLSWTSTFVTYNKNELPQKGNDKKAYKNTSHSF